MIKHDNNSLWIAACISLLAVLSAGLFWIFAHPYRVGWDEAYYVNHAVRDYQAFNRSFRDGLDSLFFNGRDRPFAYRLIALPFSLILGPDIKLLRISSFICFFAAAVFIYFTGRRLFNTRAGLSGALIFLLSPEAIASSVRFYTEAGMYLAVAAMLYYLLRALQERQARTYTWLGLGLSLGLGLLTKISFVIMAAVPLCMIVVSKIRQGMGKEIIFSMLKAGTVAVMLSFLWWFKNYSHALYHMEAAKDFAPFSLGPFGPRLILKYGFFFIKNIVGYFTAVLCLLAISILFSRPRKGPKSTTGLQKFMVWMCLFCGLPLLATQLLTVNHSMRLASPAIVPFAVMFSFFIGKSLENRRSGINILLAFLFLLQAGCIVSSLRYKNEPSRNLWEISVTKTLPLREQWNWDKVYDIIDSHGIVNPSIGLLGAAAPLNPRSVEHSWVIRNKKAFVEMIAVDAEKTNNIDEFVSACADKYDIIITIADYPYNNIKRLAEKNAMNAPFLKKVTRDTRFYDPVYVKVGRNNETTLAICIKKDL
jgi:4-amino-4-deoxy-L-arabinose transferase-like glycosyltransferase